MFNIRLTGTLYLAVILTITVNSYAQKMSPEDVIAKHLDSIGTKENRAKIKNQLILADIQLQSRGAPSAFVGKAVIFSASNKNLWGMNLNSVDYPTDRFGFNGKETRVSFIRPGVRSLLGGFVLTYNKLVEESLLGGALSSSWALLKLETKKPKLEFEGAKRIGEKETLVLAYLPKSGSDLSIKLYFDNLTFQHIRTEYRRVTGSKLVSIDSSASQGSDRYHVIEDFSDFKKMGDLTLPSTYKFYYSFINGATTQKEKNANREIELRFNVKNFSFNQQADDSFFEIKEK